MADIYDVILQAINEGQALPEGVTESTMAPRGITIADPAQREQFAAREAQSARAVAQQRALDAAEGAQQKRLAGLLGEAKGLDPRLQATLMRQLGIQNVPEIQDQKQLLAQQQLQNQLALAQYRNQLGEGQRQFSNEMAQQRAAQAQQQLMALIAQRQIQNQQGERGLDIRESAVRPMQIPQKQAQSILDSMALQGATPEKLAAAAQQMGYALGENRELGGFLGFGTTQAPILAEPARGPRTQAAGPEAQGQTMTLRKGNRTIVGPVGPVPKGWERIS